MRCLRLFLIVATCLVPTSAIADELGVFVGLDVTAGTASGSSDQTNGGAAFAGGGVVENIEFGDTIGVGGHLGYRINNALSVSLAYQHIQGDISWDANFPAINSGSSFDGTAISDTILAHIFYHVPVTNSLSISPHAGAGIAFNTLDDVTERLTTTGQFLSDVRDDTQVSPAAAVGLDVGYEIASNVSLNLNSAIAYTGGFQTGSTRSGNAGITVITPYEIDDVWRASLGASIEFKF